MNPIKQSLYNLEPSMRYLMEARIVVSSSKYVKHLFGPWVWRGFSCESSPTTSLRLLEHGR